MLDSLSRSLSVEIPDKLQTLEQYLDWVLPQVRPYSEDLREETFFLHTRWMQVTDKDDHHSAVLHIFLPGGEYLNSLNGDLRKGKWRILESSNGFIWERTDKVSELYDLAFLDSNFFILKKHGGGQKSDDKYFFMVKEGAAKGLSWRDAVEKLFNNYRTNSSFMTYLLLIVVIIAVILVLSLFR